MHASPEKGIAWRAATRLGIVEIIKAPPKKILCGRCEVLLRDGAKVERDLEIQRPARRSWDLGDGSDGAGGERAKVAVAEKGGVSEAGVLLHREADNVLKPQFGHDKAPESTPISMECRAACQRPRDPALW